MNVQYKAVIFDLGGVVLDSPLHEIARYEREHRLPPGFINRVVISTGSDGAWARLERGALCLEAFYDAFGQECEHAGYAIDTRELMRRIGQVANPRPRMLTAIHRIRAHGIKVAALTNNWIAADGESTGAPLRPLFDVLVESSVVGLHKPDPRVYELVCERLGIAPGNAVFLDDIGRNLKPARDLGMATIKVDDPETALGQLEDLLGISLAMEQ